MSVPWGGAQRLENVAYTSLEVELTSDAQKYFVKERTRLHEAYILEQAKNKRLGLVLAFLLILLASLLITFSAGALGFGRIWGKAANISFGADQGIGK